MPTTQDQLWAPFALRVRCGPLELRAVRDEDIPALVDVALAGVHDPARTPFYHPWTDSPPERLPREMAIFYWQRRAAFSKDDLRLDLVVRRDGEVVGVQGFDADHYAVVRTAETGSWLGQRHQGRGTGTLMRQAVCTLLFDHLDAAEVTSGAFEDNPSSLAVSRKVGYVDNGRDRRQRRKGELAIVRRLVLTPERFVRPPVPVVVEGAGPLRAALGLGPIGQA